jgi:hypothetical protein
MERMKKSFTAEVKAPIDLEILDANASQPDSATTPCVAMIVCHGMGQQVPFETLDAVATAIADEHMTECGTANNFQCSVDVVLRFVRPTNSDKFIPRAEITLKQEGNPVDKTVHLYEAYWAPLTEGAISYTQTVGLLLGAGLNGLKEGSKHIFSRWMFGSEKNLPIDPDTMRLLAVLLVIITPFLLLPLIGLSLKSAIDGHGIVSGYTLGLVLLLVLSYFIRNFVVQYMGDVIIYVSSNEVNCFWKIRDEIKQIGLSLAKVVYGAINTSSTSQESSSEMAKVSRPNFLYSNVVVVGHSLGSVIAYDTLNAIINQDQLDGDKRRVVDRTEAFITLGSPLDKIAFLFRQKAKNAFTRDMLAAAYQPMILSYKNRPRWWVNVFCKKDIISGSLEYYDDPQCANSEQRRVRNFADPYNRPSPISAHTGYWERPLSKTFLYLAATGLVHTVDNVSFQHSDKQVGIRSLT